MPGVKGFRMQKRTVLDREASRRRLEEAKARVSTAAAWVALGCPHTPPKDGGNSLSPFRSGDNKGAFSVSRCGRLWHDFVTGAGGDVVDFIKEARGCDAAEAIRTLYGIAGMDAGAPRPSRVWPVAPLPPPKEPEAPKAKKPLPPLREPTVNELNEIRIRRGLGPSWAGVEIMAKRGMLLSASWDEEEKGIPSFFVTDPDRLVALRRRMDGRHWASYDKDAREWTPEAGGKSKTWIAHDGAKRDNPIGLALLRGELFDAPSVFVVEGSPDAWALFALLFDALECVRSMRAFAVVVMADAGVNFTHAHADLLRGRVVRIIPQDDRHAKPDADSDSGEEAAQRWRAQLLSFGAAVSIFRLRAHLPPGGKDLCDAAAHAFAQQPGHGDDGLQDPPMKLSRLIIHGMPRFDA